MGDSAEVPLVAPRDLAVTIPAGLSLTRQMHVKVRYQGPIKAPIKKGQEIAQLVVTTGDTGEQVVPLVAGEDVGEAGFFGRAWIGLKSLLGLA
jgi:D-alanyl-D-alanine carboxypeptidase (penicillin-binding protein 5/6)